MSWSKSAAEKFVDGVAWSPEQPDLIETVAAFVDGIVARVDTPYFTDASLCEFTQLLIEKQSVESGMAKIDVCECESTCTHIQIDDPDFDRGIEIAHVLAHAYTIINALTCEVYRLKQQLEEAYGGDLI